MELCDSGSAAHLLAGTLLALPRLHKKKKHWLYLQLVLWWNVYSAGQLFMQPHRSRLTNKMLLSQSAT